MFRLFDKFTKSNNIHLPDDEHFVWKNRIQSVAKFHLFKEKKYLSIQHYNVWH